MNNYLRTYRIVKNGKMATVISDKLTYKDSNENYLLTRYCFENLTQNEMDEITIELEVNDIPYRLLAKAGKWDIVINEEEVDRFNIVKTDYESCTKEQLIQLLIEKDIFIENIKFQHDNIHKAYSQLYHLYEESQKN